MFSLFSVFPLAFSTFIAMTRKDIHPIQDKLVERSQKEKILGQRGSVFWLCGLSGSGKSTLAIDLENRLSEDEIFSIVLDGDNLRSGLNQDLGFSDDDRRENIRRTTELAKILCQSGVLVIVSCITPLQEFRDSTKKSIGTDDYKEIYVKASFSECKKRDVKGLYAKAADSSVSAFTGSTSSFEEPISPDLILDTEKETLTHSSATLYSYVRKSLSFS